MISPRAGALRHMESPFGERRVGFDREKMRRQFGSPPVLKRLGSTGMYLSDVVLDQALALVRE